MPNVSINKEAFLEILNQFKHDIPYEVKLVHTLLANMPEQVAENVIMELYFEQVYKGVVYKAVHCVYKDDINYFLNFTSLIEFLKGRSLHIAPDFWRTVDTRLIERYIKSENPLCGYIISKEFKQ